jgi:raffinose/stachyose/melibiose transport system permease protein
MDKTIKKSIVFVIPALAFYLLFIIFPLFSALRFSLFKWNGVVSAQFIGFDNFVSLFKDEYFIYVLKNTFIYVVFGSIGVVVGGLLTALIINANIPGHRIFKTLYFLPVVMSAISVGLLWRFIFNYDFGIINNFLNGIGLSEYTQNWLGNTKMVIYYVIGPVIWQYIGLYMVIFYSGIKSIPVEYFESVNIDGASVFQ